MSGPRSDPVEDARLVRAIAAGSEDALAALYDRHAGAVFATARRLSSDPQLAEDIVQETFLAVWNRADQYQPSIGSLSAWLLTIARNRTVDRLRASGRRPVMVSISATRHDEESDSAAFERVARTGAVVGGTGLGGGPEAEVAASELRTALGRALAEMSEPERQVLVMAYRDELSQSEIAARLGWPIGTVKTRTRRAFLKLRILLGPDYGPAPGPGSAGIDGGLEVESDRQPVVDVPMMTSPPDGGPVRLPSSTLERTGGRRP